MSREVSLVPLRPYPHATASSPADGPPEDARRRTVMDGAVLRVGVHALPEEALVLHLLAHQPTSDGNLLAAGNHLGMPSARLENLHLPQIKSDKTD
eukprot:365270-Chlamydomonas_euryale.AAC.3